MPGARRLWMKPFWCPGRLRPVASGEVERIRREAREASHRDAVLEGLRARRFTPQETLKQGCDLIDFALRVKEQYGEG